MADGTVDGNGDLRIVGGRVLVGGRVVPGDVAVRDGVIEGGEAPRTTRPIIDATGLIVVPGYIDLQVNGGYGVDLAREPERVGEVAGHLTQHGITAWLPTLVSSAPARLGAFLDALAGRLADASGSRGAITLGAHLEGPALAPTKAGAHVVEHLVGAAEFEEVLMVQPHLDLVRLVTIAPERPGALDLIARLRDRGIVVSVGHTDASAEEVHDAASAGARYATHLFNAMSGFHHRSPGAGIAALTDDRFTAGLILDGHHLHEDTVLLAWSMLGPSRTSLVSDATAALGGSTAAASLGSSELVVNDAVRTSSGVLAGTDLALDEAVRNLMAITGCQLIEAVSTVTSVPAGLLGDRSRGRIAPGRRGDIVLLDDDGFPHATIVGGNLVWAATGTHLAVSLSATD